VVAHDFDSSILSVVAHRPWPMPERPWIMTQTWRDLLFAHWPIDVELLRPLVPDPFELDLFQGEAWLGIVPFQMSNVSLRGIPALPWVSEFPELNVRTYVRMADRPGVYFFSLDAGNQLAVKTARTMLNLPYFSASMKVTPQGRGVLYESRRDDETGQAELVTTYRPIGPPVEPAQGSLEYFLTERYCLYNLDRAGKPYRLEIHHPAWRLQLAEAELVRNTMAEPSGSSVRIAVRDEGVGMIAADIERMFQPFQSGFRQGSGLGLAIVRRIVTDHGGRVAVQSNPGAGTEVTVTLPALPARAQVDSILRSA